MEAEERRDADELLKKKVESKNLFKSLVFSAKEKLVDKENLGDQLSDAEIDSAKIAVKEVQTYLDEYADGAQHEDIEAMLKACRDIVDPITIKARGGDAGRKDLGSGGSDDEGLIDHDEL